MREGNFRLVFAFKDDMDKYPFPLNEGPVREVNFPQGFDLFALVQELFIEGRGDITIECFDAHIVGDPEV